MWPFKKKQYVKILLTNINKETGGVGLRIDCQAPPERAMGMLLGALSDMAERYKNLHDKRPNPCDCVGIRYANAIIHHVGVINNEMRKVRIKKNDKSK